MNAGALVFCLLDAEGEYTPEGYKLLDTAVAGDYEIRLWQGEAHVSGQPVKFNEVSLNAKGHSFDPESQAKKYPGGTHALGHRLELLQIVVNWMRRWGDLYVGSYIPSKLKTYHRLFKRYLKELNISDPYAPFDECEGKAEYFHVKSDKKAFESLDNDPLRYLNNVPSLEDRLTDEAVKKLKEERHSWSFYQSNRCEIVEATVQEVVDDFALAYGNELVDAELFQNVVNRVLRCAR